MRGMTAPEGTSGLKAKPLYQTIGFMFSALLGFFAATLFILSGVSRSPITGANLVFAIASALGCAMFALSAFMRSVLWLQPLLFLLLTPVPMLKHEASLLSLGSFLASVILLSGMDFFARNKVRRWGILIMYYYLCEIAIGMTKGLHPAEYLLPLVFVSIFLVFLALVFPDKWLPQKKPPKPTLSISAFGISPMETICLRAVLEGKSFKEIAVDCGKKESTVRNTMAHVYRKLGVQDKTALIAKYSNCDLTG